MSTHEYSSRKMYAVKCTYILYIMFKLVCVFAVELNTNTTRSYDVANREYLPNQN